MEVENATVQGADPQVRLAASESGYIDVLQCEMQRRDLLSVIDQNAPLLGAHQQMARNIRQDGGNGARIGVVRENLAKGAAVEGQQSVVRGGNNKFGFARVGQDRRSQRNQR